MVNPIIISFGELQIRYYGLLLATAYLVGYFGFRYLMRNESNELIENVSFWTIIGTIVGARLVHVLFYDWQYTLKNPLWVLKIWEGGIASHGAILGGLVTLWILAKKYGKSVFYFVDPIVIIAPLSGVFIRIGNFINGELVGRITEVPWAVTFACCPGLRHPVQLYEAFSYIIVFIIMYHAYKRRGPLFDGYYLGLFLITYSVARFIVEFFKDYMVFSGGLTMGQWLTIPFFAAGVWLFYKKSKYEDRRES